MPPAMNSISSLLAILAASQLLPSAGFAQTGSDVPRAAYITVQDQEFRKMDADRNGQVTRAEIEAFQRAAAVAEAQQRNRALFAQLDTDRNGQISPAEFARLNAPAPAVDGRPLLNQMDTNRDGQISLVEHRAGKLAYFDRIDTDKDGVVTAAEMRAAGVIK